MRRNRQTRLSILDWQAKPRSSGNHVPPAIGRHPRELISAVRSARDSAFACAPVCLACTLDDTTKNDKGPGPSPWRVARERTLTAKRMRPAPRPRQRILDAAYDLFCANGINQVGIDTILAESGCAKASLYGNFDSKADLAVAFLDRREIVWTRAWLETEIKRRASNPKALSQSSSAPPTESGRPFTQSKTMPSVKRSLHTRLAP